VAPVPCGRLRPQVPTVQRRMGAHGQVHAVLVKLAAQHQPRHHQVACVLERVHGAGYPHVSCNGEDGS
jgi:hypothetical protein